MRQQMPPNRMIDKATLNQHLSGELSASSAANDLLQLREQFFGGAIILCKQPAVRIEHADHGQVRPVVTFGQNLRADDDVNLTLVDLF